jgi:hypothetical protein
MAEEEYEIINGVMMKKNPITGEFEPEEKKNEFELIVKAKAGEKTIFPLSATKQKALLNCLQQTGISFKFNLNPIEKAFAARVTIPKDMTQPLEATMSYLTEDKANKLKKCLEPLEELIEVNVRKMPQLEETI